MTRRLARAVVALAVAASTLSMVAATQPAAARNPDTTGGTAAANSAVTGNAEIAGSTGASGGAAAAGGAGATGSAGATGAAGNAAAGKVYLTAYDVGNTSAKLELHGHSAAWWYQQARPSSDSCTSVAAGTSTVSEPVLMGTEHIFKAYSDASCTTELTDDATDAHFTTRGVVLSQDWLIVPEGSTADHTVRLSTQPTGSVTVTVTSTGDSDITADADVNTANSQSTMTFTAENWANPQTVRLSAAADTDTVPGQADGGKGDGSYAQGTATFTYTATSTADAGYNNLAVTLNADEADDDVCGGTAAVNNATTGSLVDDCNTLLGAKDRLWTAFPTHGSFATAQWDTATAIGSWEGVTVGTVSGSSRVTQLNLGVDNYGGQRGNVPNTIGSLDALTRLSIWSGGAPLATGAFPAGITGLTSLTYLVLGNRGLSGPIPTDIGSLTSLTYLSLAGNELSGPIPSGLGSLTDLTRMYLYDNRLAGQVPTSLSGLTKLVSLWVNNNDLTGPVPGTLSSLSKLDAGMGLVAYNNRLSGCVPTALSAAMGTNEVNPQRDAAGNSVNLQLCSAGFAVAGENGSAASPTAPVAVPEGSSTDATVRLLTKPTASVTVTVSLSGDSDITSTQTTLTFTTTNWAQPQSLRLSAAADTDHEPGASTVTLTAASTDSSYSGATGTFTATELEDDAILGAVDADAASVRLRLSGHAGWYTRQLAPQGNSACVAMSDSSDRFERLRPSRSYRLGAYLDAACTDLIAEADAATAAARRTVELSAAAVTDTSATLEISGHDDASGNTKAWYYKRHFPVSDTCTSVAAGTSTASLSSLDDASRYTYKAYSDSVCNTQLTDDLSDVDFTTPGVVLNTDFLIVPEGDYYDHTVQLATEPAGDVTVAITRTGDSDLTADTDTGTTGNQTTLTFTATNWATPQEVRLSAAQDTDTVPSQQDGGKGDGSYAHGAATFTYTTSSSADSDYSGRTATLAATEGDDDVCQGTTAVGGSGVTTGNFVNDCNTLLAAKDVIGSFAGSNWSTGTAMGSWAGITVGTVSSESRVTELNLGLARYVNSRGNMPNTIADLTALTFINMSSANHATKKGPWPDGLENLTGLTRLDMYKRRLTGTIPASIGNLTALTRLAIDENHLTGPIPASIGSLSSVTTMWISPNGFSGPIPASMGQLTALTSLALDGMGLTGFIPHELGTPSYASNGLNLTGNYLTGCVPTSMSSRPDSDINPQRDAAGHSVWLPLCTAGVAVSDTTAAVAEGGHTDLDVRLWTAPTNSVTVTVTATGDSSVTVDTDTSTQGSQSTLTFTTTNWSTPQTVRVAAADDADDASGTATLAFAATSADTSYSDIGSVAVADELDDDAVLAVMSRTDTAATLALSGHAGWHYRRDFPQGDDSCRAASGAVALSGLAGDSRYRYGAYLDDLCTDRIDERSWATSRTGASVALTASSVTDATATLTIEGHTDTSDSTKAWWYKQTAPSAGTCTSVTAGTSTASLSSLEQATEYVFKAYSDSACNTQLTDDLTDASFATPGVVLNTDFLIVPEGDSYDHTVHLTAPPAGSVTVTVSSTGDADITADTDTVASGNQTTLAFTAANWATPQTVRLSAAQDTDTVPEAGKGDGSYAQGTTTFTYTASSAADSNYSGRTATLAAYEGDDDVCQGTTAVGGSGVTSGGLVDDCNTLLAGKDIINGTKADKLATNWDTGTAIGSWRGITAAAVSGAQRVTKLNGTFGISPNNDGNVPNTVGDLGELTVLRLVGASDSNLKGPWPKGIENLTGLTEIEFYNRRLTGSIPAAIGNLTELEKLQIDNNDYLSGTIPSSIGSLTELTQFSLGGQLLTGPIPAEFGNLTDLTRSWSNDSRFTGYFPGTFNNLTSVTASTSFDWRDNYISGCIPTGFAGPRGAWLNPQLDAAGNSVTLPVCSAGIAVSESTGETDQRVSVAEGGSVDLDVRLWTAPWTTVTVEVVTAPSGDSDITADADPSSPGNQSALTFTTANWATPQTVRISAGADDDDDAGIATIALRTDSTDGLYDGLSEGIVAVEVDSDATLTAGGRTASTVKLTLSGDGDWWYRQNFPVGDDRCRKAVPASGAGAANAVTLSGIDSTSPYRFGAYGDASCTELIDTAVMGALLNAPASVTAYRGRHFTVQHGSGYLDVFWPPVPGATGYDIVVRGSGINSTWKRAATAVAGTVEDDGSLSYRIETRWQDQVYIDNANSYTVAVRAIDAYGASGWRNSAAVPVLSNYQQAPSNVSVSRHDGELRVSWTQCDITQASCAGDTPITHLAVNVKPADDTWRRAVTLTEYTSGSTVSVTGYLVGSTTVPIDNARPYVVAVGVYTRYTAVWTNTPEQGPSAHLHPPAWVGGTLNGSTLRARWTSVAGASGYQVNISDDNKQTWRHAADVSGSGTVWVDITVDDPDATHHIAVRTLRYGYPSPWWRDSQAIAPTLAVPTHVNGYRGFNFVDLEWNAAAGATGYNVHYRARPTASHWWSPWHVSDYTGTTPSYRLNAAPNTSRYQFRVQAVHSSGTSEWVSSNEVTPVTIHQQPAGNVSVVRGDGQLTVSFTHCNWQEPGCAGSTPITHYAVNVLDNGTWRRAQTIPVSSSVVGGTTVTFTDIDINDPAANPVVNSATYIVAVGVYTRYWAAWTNHGPIPAHTGG